MDYWSIEYSDLNLWPKRCTSAAILALEKIRESVNLCRHVVSSVFLCTSHLQYLTNAYNSTYSKYLHFIKLFFLYKCSNSPDLISSRIYIYYHKCLESWNFYGICNKHFSDFSSHVIVNSQYLFIILRSHKPL